MDLAAELLELPLFASLKKKATDDKAERVEGKKDLLQELRTHARLVSGQDRRAFIRQNDFTTGFFLILRGVVSAYRSKADGGRERLFSMKEGDWFGEYSRLSNQAFRVDLMAEPPADGSWLVVEIPAETFSLLYSRDKGFSEQIDKRHKKNSLDLQLRFAPLFRRLSEGDADRLRSCVEFQTFKEGDFVAKQGTPAEAIYLVQSGGVARIAVGETNLRSIQAFYGPNSSFGEFSLAEGAAPLWPTDHRATTRTELLVVPRAKVEGVYRDRLETLAGLRTVSRMIQAEEEGASTGIFETGMALEETTSAFSPGGQEKREVLVRKQSFKGGEALVIDLKRCTRCNMCVESCVAVHEDGIPRLSKKGNRISIDLVLTTSCYNCAIPECMLVCNDGAIRRDHQGLIRFIYDNCIGCTQCMAACPYDVIRMTPPPAPEPEPRPGVLGFLERVPGLGRLLGAKACASPADKAKSIVKGKAVKCDLCAGMPFEACVYNCPCNAISRVSPGDLLALEELETREVVTLDRS